MSGTRVLVVDDDTDGANTLAFLLGIYGYVAKAITDARECLASLRHFKPDVVLLDIAMPGLSGIKLAKMIRTLPESDRITIIAVSGFVDKEHVRASLEAGCDQHLAKPATLHDLEVAMDLGVRKRLEFGWFSDEGSNNDSAKQHNADGYPA
jgi:CheY-like chemotaxis protein